METKTKAVMPIRGKAAVQFETPFCLTVNFWWKLRGIAEIAILQFYFDACENLATAILQLAVQLFVTLGADHPLAGWANGPLSKKDCLD